VTGTKFFGWIIILPAGGRILSILLANPRFEVMRHDITLPLYVEMDEIYNLRTIEYFKSAA
jgi:hypothetical protein